MTRLKNSPFHPLIQIFLLVFLAFSPDLFARVKSMSVEIEMANGEGKKVYVSCRGDNRKRILLNLNRQKEWCDSDLPEFCSFKKISAARLVCSGDYTPTLEAETATSPDANKQPPQLSPDKAIELRKELMAIEYQRINIADKLLVLKRKEIELYRKYPLISRE